MLLKNLQNLLTNRSSFLHGDRFVFATGGGKPDDQNTGGTSDGQGNPTTADPQDPNAETDFNTEAEAHAEGERQKAQLELQQIKSTIEPLQNQLGKGKELISELDDHLVEIGDQTYYLKYLEWLLNRIETKGGKWFLPQDGGVAQRVSQVTENLSKIARQLAGNERIDAVKIDGTTSRKEAIDAIKDLIAGVKKKKEQAEQKLLDKLDRTMQEEIARLKALDVRDNQKQAHTALIKGLEDQLGYFRTHKEDSFEEQYKNRIKVFNFLRTKGQYLEASQSDKARLAGQEDFQGNKIEGGNPLDTKALRAKLEEYRKRKGQEVDPYVAQIKAKADAIEAKLESRVVPVIMKAFADNEQVREAHLDRIKGVKKRLDSWRNMNYYDVVLGPGGLEGLNTSDLLDPETGEFKQDEELKKHKIGVEDWIKLAEDSSVSQAIRENAMLTAQDMLAGVGQTIGRPKEVAETVMTEYDTEIDRYISDLTEKNKASGGYTIQLLALYDFKHMGEKLVEWAKRKYTRRSDKVLGNFGATLLKDLPGPLKTAANEFDRLKEQSELDEVEQYKKSYSNKDAWQITEVMHKTTNSDEMKACLYLLADLGRIRWDDPVLWKQLMYFNKGAVQFNVKDPEAEMENQGRLHDKLQKTVGVIWDYDTFQTWQTTNESNYSSKMESHKNFCDKNAEMAGNLDKVMSQMLADYKKAIKEGKVPKVDPQKFEKMIHYNIEFGKGSPEGKLYFMIQGIACGLLSRDIASRVNSKWINQYPVIDVFGSGTDAGEKPTMDDIRRWARLDGDKNFPGKSYHKWFYTYVIHRPRVYQRVDKALTSGMSQDHDDATCWFGAMSPNTVETILSQNSQGFRMPVTGYQNASIGMLHYLDNLSENFDVMGAGETGGVNQLVRFASMFAVYDGITAGRMHQKSTQFFRWNGEEHNEPRSSTNYKHCYGRGTKADPAGSTTQGFINKIRKNMEQLEPGLFEFLHKRSKAASSAEIKAFSESMQYKYKNKNIFGEGVTPSSTEELHQHVSNFMRNVFQTAEGQANIQKMLSAMREEHRKIESELGSDFPTVEEQWEKDMKKTPAPTFRGSF